MTIEYVGGEMGSLVPSDANVIEATASLGGSGASYDSNFARCYTRCYGSSAYALTPELTTPLTDFWVHFELDQWNATNSATLRTVMEMLDGSGVAKFRLQTSWSSGFWMLHYYNGSSWVDLGTQFTASGDTLQTIDIHIVCNSASGSANMYLSGTNRLNSGTVDLSSITGIAQLKCYGNSVTISGYNAFSQIIMASGESTIGMRLMTMYPSGNGATDQWTGGYTAVDETVYSDADFIWSDTANQVEVMAGTLAGSLTGYSIRAIGVTARANTDGTGPTQIQLAVRTAATNYFSSSQTLDAGYGAFVGLWEDDPNTTIDWTTTDAAAIQFGVKSIA